MVPVPTAPGIDGMSIASLSDLSRAAEQLRHQGLTVRDIAVAFRASPAAIEFLLDGHRPPEPSLRNSELIEVREG